MRVVLFLFVWLACSACSIAQISEQPSSELIQQLGESDKDRRRDAAYELVRRRDESPDVIKALAKAISDDDAQVRFQSLLGLARAGAAAEPAIDALLICLDDRDDQIRYRAADALGKIGQPSLKALLEKWDDSSERAKIAICRAITELGPVAEPSRGILTDALEASGSEIPRYAAEAIVAISPQDEHLIALLVSHQDVTVRLVGISALAAILQPSSETVDELCKAVSDSEQRVREAAIIAVAKASLDVAEKEKHIEAALFDDAESVRDAAIVAMRKSGIAGDGFANRISQRLLDADAEKGTAVLKALAALGPAARETLPTLLEYVERQGATQSDHAELLTTLLASFGDASVDDLLAAIKQRPTLEPLLANSLAAIGEPAVPAIVKNLGSDDELIRIAAARAIGNLQSLDEPLIEKLAATKNDISERVRTVAISSLLKANPSSEIVKSAVLEALDDENESVRAAAFGGLATLNLGESERYAAIERGLDDMSSDVRSETLSTLKSLPQAALKFVSRVLELAGDESADVRVAAIRVLGEIPKEEAGDGVIVVLESGLRDSHRDVQLASTLVVEKLKPSGPQIVAAIGDNFVDDVDLLHASLTAVTGLGTAAASLKPNVLDVLKHDAAVIRIAAIDALSAIETDENSITEQMLALLEDPEWEVRRQAAVQLGKLGASAKAAVPKLFALLKSDQDTGYANGVLDEIGTAPPEAIPMLLENIESDDRRVAFLAITLLGKMGPEAAVALPKLEALLNDSGRSGGGRGEFRKRFIREAIQSIKGESN